MKFVPTLNTDLFDIANIVTFGGVGSVMFIEKNKVALLFWLPLVSVAPMLKFQSPILVKLLSFKVTTA